jgi:hypothetical protein
MVCFDNYEIDNNVAILVNYYIYIIKHSSPLPRPRPVCYSQVGSHKLINHICTVQSTLRPVLESLLTTPRFET